VEAPDGSSVQKRHPDPACAGTWPEPSPPIASDCGRLTAKPEVARTYTGILSGLPTSQTEVVLAINMVETAHDSSRCLTRASP
jgi:hypothetical protein